MDRDIIDIRTRRARSSPAVQPAEKPIPIREELANPEFLFWYMPAELHRIRARLEAGDTRGALAELAHLELSFDLAAAGVEFAR